MLTKWKYESIGADMPPRKSKSSGDVVLTHRLISAAGTERQVNPKLISIDMSEAFDAVRRTPLIPSFERIISQEILNAIKIMSSNTNSGVQTNKVIRQKFQTNGGVSQRVATSPKKFNFYVNDCLGKINNVASNSNRNYCRTRHNLPSHIELLTSFTSKC